MEMNIKYSLVVILLLIYVSIIQVNAQPTWIESTNNEPWKVKEISETNILNNNPIDISNLKRLQIIEGFGGAFSEQGWQALQQIDKQNQDKIFNALFSNEGANFEICRVPVGASDFGLEWWSLNNTRGDFKMENFSIKRDKQYYIPYIKAAMEFKPELKVWASPWSPPAWMKASNFFACKGENAWDNCCEEISENSHLIFTEQNQEAYALYLAKFVNAYQNEGINLYALHVQNEPAACQIFPSCLWTGEQLRDFIKNYLGPHFDLNNVDAEIWLGSINNGEFNKYAGIVLADEEAKKYISGVGYQWAGKNAIGENHAKYPNMKLMQTESECGNGLNTWEFSEYTFSLINHYLKNGANSYLYWNMVLDEHAFSTWMWRQNSLVTVNTANKTYSFNPEFYLMKHFSHFIPVNSYLLENKIDNLLAFLTPKNKVVIVFNNNQDDSIQKTFKIHSKTYSFTFKPHSFSTIVF
jgi:glucosylceramidase